MTDKHLARQSAAGFARVESGVPLSSFLEAGEGDVNSSARRLRWQDSQLGQETLALLEEDARHFFHQSLSTPCLDVLVGCRGTSLTSLEGRAYLDFHGNSVHQIGFSHPRVIEAITRQLDTLSFCPRRYTNPPAIALADRLCTLMGDNYKVLFAPGATSAISMALKLARLVTGRFKTISFWDSFHGASLDAISVGGEAMFRAGLGPLLTGCAHVPPPEPDRCPFNAGGGCGTCDLRCLRYLEYVLEKESDIAAVIAEPIRCTTGSPPPPGYWQAVRTACDRHGALLIFDETAVCLGRTGEIFAHRHFAIEPDILVLGKGLGGAVMPLAAMLARREFDIAGHTSLGHFTHEKNPVACAAALATLDVIVDEHLVPRSREMGERLLEELKQMMEGSRQVRSVHGLGLLAGVRMASADAAEEVMYRALSKGLSFKVSQGDCLTLTPPLTIAAAELDRALAILSAAIAELE